MNTLAEARQLKKIYCMEEVLLVWSPSPPSIATPMSSGWDSLAKATTIQFSSITSKKDGKSFRQDIITKSGKFQLKQARKLQATLEGCNPKL